MNPLLLYQTRQDELLVAAFDQGEVALDAIEIRGVGQVKYRRDA